VPIHGSRLGPAGDQDQRLPSARFQVMQPDAVTGRDVTCFAC
jgi:hypothetical protein